MKVTDVERKRLQGTISELRSDRLPFWSLWRDLANYFLPKRYVWLLSGNEARLRTAKNPYILDPTGTTAARILASGMMNGITSPSRPWFRMRIAGFEHEGDAIAVWADEVVRRMLLVMAESNFYNAMAVLYLDLVVFGTAGMLIYEDDETVIRCYNPALGEFYIGQSHRLAVDTFAREFKQSVKQLASNFGEENLSETLRLKYKQGGANALHLYDVTHLIEPNFEASSVPNKFKYVETYWETASFSQGSILARRGFNELPGIFPRWELTANDSYGTGPAMDALPDVIQLQHETKRKAQGIDKMVSPPIVADIQLEHRPTALMPNGITFVAGSNNIGAKPLYQIQAPIQEMTEDISSIQLRIREIFHNNLFNMISQLDTVRSATEIDARREEKLVMLGSVLDRFESEALGPAINRIYSIMERQGMLPEPPPEVEGMELEVQYVSILSTAQSAVAAAPVERFAQFVGNLAGIAPEVLQVPDWAEMARNYGTSIGVQARDMKTREAVEAANEEEKERLAAQQAGVEGKELVDAGKVLSETDVGGGANALQQLLAQG